MSSGLMPALRRNGKPPSCEPCRRSKYSCDHTTPVCGRCQRRGIAIKCLYHPAPMKGLTPRAQKKNQVKRARSLPSSQDQEADRSSSTPTARNTIVAAQEPGFLGSTSYNAVLAESGLDSQIDVDDAAIVAPTQSRPRRLREAIAILELLSDFPHLERIVDRWSIQDRSLSIIGYFSTQITAALRNDLYKMEVWKTEASLIQTAETLFANTDSRIRVSQSCKFVDYYKHFTGSNIRWEAMCILFTACGLGCNCLRCDEPIFDFVGHTEDHRQDFMYKLMQASNACISFCEDAGQLSDLALWSLLENGIYNSQVLGDAHYLTWRKIGDVSTAIFAQGLHQESKDTSKLPFWMVEMRRRALGSAYSIDKLLCTFVGRPPRISQRYCSVRIPLDLEFSELALEGPKLDSALANIGSDGWNTSWDGRKSCYQRCFVLVARLREEVLELSLGPPQENMLEKAMEIIRRNQELMASLPDYICFKPGKHDRDVTISFFAAQEYLDIMYNEFMLRRTMVRQLRDDPKELLHVAQKILSAVVEASTIRFARTTDAACVPWMAVLYGLPAAGVLAVELLQQKSRAPPPGLPFPRAKIIQDLSVFISSLKWVHAPCEGNYHIVEQAHKTLQHILDCVLSDTPSMSQDGKEHRMATGQGAQPSPGDSGYIGSAENGEAGWDFSWLDNADFDAGFWANVPDNPLLL